MPYDLWSRAGMIEILKKQIYESLEMSPSSNWLGKLFSFFIIGLIILNMIAVALETIREIHEKYYEYFRMLEALSIIVFTAEYALRLWSCTSYHKYRNPFFGRLKFALTPLAIIDLLVIVSYCIPALIHIDLRALRSFRLLRLLPVLKMGRYSRALKTIFIVISNKKEELISSLLLVLFLLFIASCLMFYLEDSVQPEAFSNIFSTMWWGIVTLTTVGYGDVYPITPLGKILGSIISLLGVGLFALPSGIIASGFAEEFQKAKNEKKICPHCGKQIN